VTTSLSFIYTCSSSFWTHTHDLSLRSITPSRSQPLLSCPRALQRIAGRVLRLYHRWTQDRQRLAGCLPHCLVVVFDCEISRTSRLARSGCWCWVRSTYVLQGWPRLLSLHSKWPCHSQKLDRQQDDKTSCHRCEIRLSFRCPPVFYRLFDKSLQRDWIQPPAVARISATGYGGQVSL